MYKRIIALLISILIVMSALVSCAVDSHTGDGEDSSSDTSASVDTPADTDPIETDPPETDPPVVPESDFVMTADGSYRIVYSDEYANLGTTSPYVKRIMQFTSALKKSTGFNITRGTDYAKTGKQDPDTVEILVGNTTYPESQKIIKQLTYSNYIISVEGNKLVICGYSDDALDAAMTRVAELIASCTKDGKVTIPADTFIVEDLGGNGYDIPVYTAGSFDTTYTCSADGFMYIFRDTTAAEFADYLKTLESAGYTEYTTNTIHGNTFATYTNSDCTVNAGYYDYEDTARIIVEPLAEPVGLESDVKYTAVTTTSITMLGCGYDTSGTGLSMIIRLPDGSFIIIDGGHGRQEKADQLLKALKTLSKDYRKSGEKIRIADWIITHPHSDHYYMFLNYYDTLLNDCTLERVVANTISETEREAAMSTYTDLSYNSSMSRWADIYTTAEAFGAKVQQVRTGQVLYRPGVKMEVLYTIDSFAPNLCNAVNTMSLVIKMTFDDGTTFMMTGDATGNAMEVCANMYGNYLKSDILQVSHHGYSTWGNDNGVILGYAYIAPKTLLWPTSDGFYPTARNYGYNSVLFSTAVHSNGKNRNFKEVYVAGPEYNAYTTPIPYSVGNTYNWKIS